MFFKKEAPDPNKVVKTNQEWKSELNDMQYAVLREKATEPAFCGLLLHNKKPGMYVCVACKNPLFKSDSKFDSGTGWPSFFQPISKESVKDKTDLSHGTLRTEILCKKCDGHLGHVFNDGPKPTGQRYCMNSAALEFVEQQNRDGSVSDKQQFPK